MSKIALACLPHPCALRRLWCPNTLQEVFSEVLSSENSIFTGSSSNPISETLENRCFFTFLALQRKSHAYMIEEDSGKTKHNGT
jgi:hypothetical protein